MSWLQEGVCREPAIAAYLQDQAEPRPTLLGRLRLALLDLDAAPIGTLHGLCLRILGEYPLESGSDPTGLELVDEPALRRELLDDLWRGLTQSASVRDPVIDAVTRQLLDDGRDRLLKSLSPLLQDAVGLRAPEAARVSACAHLPERRAWAPAWRDLAEDAAAFARVNSSVRKELRALADLVERTHGGFRLTDPLKYLAGTDRENLFKQFHKDRRAAMHDDPALTAALVVAPLADVAQRLLRGAGLAHCRGIFLALRQRRLSERRLIGYDDMIGRVHDAVCGRASLDGALADRLFERWPVALVDEFQDTDPRQYAIFDRVYGGRGSLLLVGDPKQAIYGFRGGDVHTYQRAAADCPSHLKLDHNHRASRAMVEALNNLYARGADGFRIPPGPTQFGYVEVKPTSRRDGEPYTHAGDPVDRPLTVHALPVDQDPLRAPQRVSLALESCAGLVAATLASGDHRIGARALQAGDIAILLPRHQDVFAMRQALRRHGIPAAGAGRSDVFSADWARALQLQLWAWLHPTDADAARAALLSPLHAVPLDRLHPEHVDADFLGTSMRQIAEQAERWRRGGVAAALAPLIENQTPRLMTDAAAGERALTDLRHLTELLAVAESEGHRDESLWHWLAARRADEGIDADARQLRIESDQQRVRLMTLHAAKGLEFHWVLLPLMWNQTPRTVDWPIGFDDSTGDRFVDLGSASYEATRDFAAEEDQRERLRVLYVALTRASHRCDVWAMDPERPAHGGSKSAVAEAKRSAVDLLLQPLFAAQRDGGRIGIGGVAWRQAWPKHDVSLPVLEHDGAAITWPEPPPVPKLRSLASFSSLTHRRRAETARAQDEVETPADEDAATAAATPHPELLEWNQVGGPAFGNALHGMLERRDPNQAMSVQTALVHACLREFGCPTTLLRREWLDRIARRLDCVLTSALEPGLSLVGLSPRQQRAELDFRMLLDEVSLARLRDVLTEHACADLLPASVPIRELSGLLTGKIDLVFEHDGRLHVLDYKSNRLGSTMADYAATSLQHAMKRHGYGFQALLYTLAVHRYARQRRHDYHAGTHLGPCWYLFLRGVGLDTDVDSSLGIWRHQFAPELIEEVDGVFVGVGAAGERASAAAVYP